MLFYYECWSEYLWQWWLNNNTTTNMTANTTNNMTNNIEGESWGDAVCWRENLPWCIVIVAVVDGPCLPSLEVALCPLLPWCSTNLTWVYDLGIIYLFFTLRRYFFIFLMLFQLIITSYLNFCPTYHIFRRLLMSHRKCHMCKVFAESIYGIFLQFFHIVATSCHCTIFKWTWLIYYTLVSHKITHFLVSILSSENPYCLVSQVYWCHTGYAFAQNPTHQHTCLLSPAALSGSPTASTTLTDW